MSRLTKTLALSLLFIGACVTSPEESDPSAFDELDEDEMDFSHPDNIEWTGRVIYRVEEDFENHLKKKAAQDAPPAAPAE